MCKYVSTKYFHCCVLYYQRLDQAQGRDARGGRILPEGPLVRHERPEHGVWREDE